MKKDSKFVKALPIIIIIMIVIFTILVLTTIGGAILKDSKNPTKSELTSQEQARSNLLSNLENRSVRMTVRGPIVAQENFRSYAITISNKQRSMVTHKGYLGDIIETKISDNNPQAYAEFVNALDKAALLKGKPLPEDKDNTKGVCATGNLYEFDLLVSGESDYHLWTSDCKGSRGSLLANSKQLKALFLNQIPGAETLIKNSKAKK